MEFNWMGRYQEIIDALVLHGNVVLRTQATTSEIGEGILLKPQQWQILEYIVRNCDKTFSMIDISYRLNIPQSTFSKTVKLLYEYDLVEKYQTVNNRKNIILRPTEKGLQVYRQHAEYHVKPFFESFIDALRDVADEDLHAVAKAIEALDNEMLPERKEEVEMIRLEKQKAHQYDMKGPYDQP